MMFWLVAGLMTVVAVGLLLPPLLRRPIENAPRRHYDLAVYRDQLAEVGRDLDRGVLTQDQAAAARTEIERRLLVAGDRADGNGTSQAGTPAVPTGRRSRLFAAGLACTLPAAAVALYLLLGAPGVPSLPLAERAVAGSQASDMTQLVERLARRMAESPGDVQGWILLARSYAELRRYAEAAEAYRRVIAQGDDSAAIWSDLGEVLTARAGGSVTAEAREAFASALKRDPRDPRARYYGGLAFAQDNRMEEALGAWMSLAADSPPDAPWRPLVEQQIARAQEALGLPQEAPATPGPDAQDLAAAAEMSAEEQNAFIRSMVDRLATRLEDEPDDLNGWLRLTRAYTVLGERRQAADALERAAALAADLPAGAPERQAVERARAALADLE